MRENEIGTRVLEAAIHVHRELGPGLLERVYEVILVRELTDHGLKLVARPGKTHKGYCRFARAFKYSPIDASKDHPHLIRNSQTSLATAAFPLRLWLETCFSLTPRFENPSYPYSSPAVLYRRWHGTELGLHLRVLVCGLDVPFGAHCARVRRGGAIDPDAGQMGVSVARGRPEYDFFGSDVVFGDEWADPGDFVLLGVPGGFEPARAGSDSGAEACGRTPGGGEGWVRAAARPGRGQVCLATRGLVRPARALTAPVGLPDLEKFLS